MAKKDKEFEEAVEIALKEGFNLADMLEGVRLAEVDVKVFMDSQAAFEAVELNAQIADLMDSDSVHTINESPAQAEIERLVAIRERMEKSAVTFTLRALSSAELSVIKRTVARNFPIAKNLPQDEKIEAEAERAETVNEHILAVSCTAVRLADGRTNPGVTIDDAKRLRKSLPVSEWNKIVEGSINAMTRAQVADKVMGEATFQWSDTVAE